MSDVPAVRLRGINSPFHPVGPDFAELFSVRVGRN